MGKLIALVATLLCTANSTAVASPEVASPSKPDDGNEEGVIERARDNIRDDERDDVRDHRRTDERDHRDETCTPGYDCPGDEDDEDEESLGSILAMYVLTTPFWLPSGLMGDWPTPPSARQYQFRAYPYEAGAAGQFAFAAVDENGTPTTANPWALSLLALASYERHSSTLEGQRIRGALRTNRRIGLDAELTRYDEELSMRTDHLWHYKILGTHSFAVSEHVHMQAAMGLRGVRFAAGDHRAGFLFRYGFEVLPVRPLHVWVMGEVGNASSSFAGELEVGIGVLVSRFELFAGYRAFRVAGVDFAGPEAGIIIWM